jgi:hypothetical protein
MATRNVRLTDAGWEDLGSGPALLSAHGDEIYFALGRVAPSDEIGHILRFESNPVKILAEERIWARSLPGGRYARAIVTGTESALGGSPVSAKNFK